MSVPVSASSNPSSPNAGHKRSPLLSVVFPIATIALLLVIVCLLLFGGNRSGASASEVKTMQMRIEMLEKENASLKDDLYNATGIDAVGQQAREQEEARVKAIETSSHKAAAPQPQASAAPPEAVKSAAIVVAGYERGSALKIGTTCRARIDGLNPQATRYAWKAIGCTILRQRIGEIEFRPETSKVTLAYSNDKGQGAVVDLVARK